MTVDAHHNEFKIDGLKMRRIILQNAIVAYDGGDVVLEDVYFLNCIFRMTNGSRGERIANSLFTGSPASVRISE
jgi:hypothetical protein